jgi:hypothetical protein
METPLVLALNVPHQTTLLVTLLPTFAKEAGTRKASPLRKISSSPETGTVVIQVLVMESKDVVAQVAEVEKVICALEAPALNRINESGRG